MSSDSIIAQLRSKSLLKRFQEAGVKHVWLFGSGARDELQAESDIDLLYEADVSAITDGWGVWGLYGELEEKLGRKIELISKKTLDPSLQKQVFSSMIQVF